MADDLPTPGDPTRAALAPRPWGPIASAWWTLLAVLVLGGLRLATTIGFAIARLAANRQADPAGLAGDGVVVAVGILIAAPVAVLLVAFLAAVRGGRVGDYLAIRPPTARALVLGVATLILGLAALDGLTIYLRRPIVPPVPLAVIATAPLGLVALAVAATLPAAEEVLFRGFLYRGLADSPRFGPGMAIGLTALAWTAASLRVDPTAGPARTWGDLAAQVDLYHLAGVYLLGLYLGLVRHLSGSVPLVILLHGLASIAAVAEAIYLDGP